MCVTFLMLNQTSSADEYQLILINNRDESYDRPAHSAEFLNEHVICGRDFTVGKEGGTWLAVSKKRRIAVLQNILQPASEQNPDAKGRGFLVHDFLASELGSHEFCANLRNDADSYNGFSLICLHQLKSDGLWHASYFCSEDGSMTPLPEGIYGFGNSHHNKPWHKVQHGLHKFQEVLIAHAFNTREKDDLIAALLKVLGDRTKNWPDTVLKYQARALPEVLARELSSCFVEFPRERGYGTRTHTIVLVDGAGHCTYYEKTLQDFEKGEWSEAKFEFDFVDC